jgi:hypothetical protein
MEGGGIERGQVERIESLGRPPTPEDVWNAAIRAGVDPARMALSLSHVLCVVPDDPWCDEEPAEIRYTLKTGALLTYGATYPNPFMNLE